MKKVKSKNQIKQFFKIFDYWHKQGKIGSVPLFILYRARDNGELFFLTNKKNEPLGIAWLIPRKRPFVFAQLKTLAIEKDHLGKGYGSKLLDEIIKEAKRQKYDFITTGVLVDNLPAKKLYKKHGFSKVAQTKTPSGIVTDELIKKL